MFCAFHLPLEAPELSYLFDFIDIDESGQVNKEDTSMHDMEDAMDMCVALSLGQKEILFLETDSEAGTKIWQIWQQTHKDQMSSRSSFLGSCDL